MIDSESKVTESEMGVLESKDDDSDRPLAQFVPPLAPILRRFLVRSFSAFEFPLDSLPLNSDFCLWDPTDPCVSILPN